MLQSAHPHNAGLGSYCNSYCGSGIIPDKQDSSGRELTLLSFRVCVCGLRFATENVLACVCLCYEY